MDVMVLPSETQLDYDALRMRADYILRKMRDTLCDHKMSLQQSEAYRLTTFQCTRDVQKTLSDKIEREREVIEKIENHRNDMEGQMLELKSKLDRMSLIQHKDVVTNYDMDLYCRIQKEYYSYRRNYVLHLMDFLEKHYKVEFPKQE